MISVSLCMIVKNEEQVLSRCLNSIADLMDEIINKHMIRNRLNKFDKQAIRIEILLGCSPKTKLKNG